MPNKEFDEEKNDDAKDTQTELIGAFGLWQGSIYMACALTIIIHAWQMMANKFLTYPLDHWCERPNNYQSVSIEKWLNISSPKLPDGSFDRCNMFDIDYNTSVALRPSEDTQTIACDSWEYEEALFQVFELIECNKRVAI